MLMFNRPNHFISNRENSLFVVRVMIFFSSFLSPRLFRLSQLRSLFFSYSPDANQQQNCLIEMQITTTMLVENTRVRSTLL